MFHVELMSVAVECYTLDQGSLVGDSPRALRCVLEQDALSSA